MTPAPLARFLAPLLAALLAAALFFVVIGVFGFEASLVGLIGAIAAVVVLWRRTPSAGRTRIGDLS